MSTRVDGAGGVIRKAGLVAFVLTGVAGVLAFWAGSASAVGVHPFKETFGSAAQPSFNEPAGIAVDQATGDLYVVDSGAGYRDCRGL